MNEVLHAVKDFLISESALHGPLVPLEPPKTFAQKIMDLVDDAHPVCEMKSLDDLQRYVQTSILTPIDQDRTLPVFGDGNPQATIMLIGEAPGADEDKTGSPFVGRAGQLLDKMLAAIDLSRQDIYITNILKSRPPKNRDPNPDEVAAHLPVLYRQLSLIAPEIILCLGRVSGQTILETASPLNQLRGQIHGYHGASLIVTYHPAALLRNSTWKRPTWEDLKLLRELYLSQ
ncbi:MAG: uracil-DNA glycosylase [Bacteroidetes bacterium]|nr:uracil-DNA glycosylase [Bacteroidota bacterium]MCY4232894.1 uracil-DNA glycosylase [Bacteroidota bacterium]